ncbi:MAG: PD-(D/E)XK nuclease domain-containing protein [Gammaproteobacteria bacterium]|nr:PD-(D/E)XK nuclease domain-containing protein [Gammaproteobacteria bacterium]
MLLALADLLNASDEFRCLYVNVEGAQTAREDVGRGMKGILGAIGMDAINTLRDSFVEDHAEEVLEKTGPDFALAKMLTQWCEASPLPLVLLIDEIDSLVGDTLVSVLRQLRSGYHKRPALFPQSVILCGVRNVRDYRIDTSSEKDNIAGGSAFNIKSDSLRLGNFCEREIRTLLAQHTEETGQVFQESAISRIVESTAGQPWLVNALAYETCFKDKAARQHDREITVEAVDAAREAIILRRETHLDQLTDKLKEDRVRRVIEPILAGTFGLDMQDHDLEYARDLGLVAADSPIRIANPIYAEVIPRALTWAIQEKLTLEMMGYQAGDTLDIEQLIEGFQDFYRLNSEHWEERFEYKEAGQQLLLQAYLQRVVNGSGHLHREYATGRGRTDLLVSWPLDNGEQRRIVIECKVRRARNSMESIIAQGLEQIRGYMDNCGTFEGHLVVFESDASKTWDERIFRREEAGNGTMVVVWGC